MANSDRMQMNGTIIETLKGGQFRVELENGFKCIGTLSGKMRVNSIRLIPGDKVLVDMSPYDLSICRIIYREKTVNPNQQQQK